MRELAVTEVPERGAVKELLAALALIAALSACAHAGAGGLQAPSAAFVGTWDSTGTLLLRCSDGSHSTNPISGQITIGTEGSDDLVLVESALGIGCDTRFTVVGRVASIEGGSRDCVRHVGLVNLSAHFENNELVANEETGNLKQTAIYTVTLSDPAKRKMGGTCTHTATIDYVRR